MYCVDLQIWSRPKWTQVIASARKSWPNGDSKRMNILGFEHIGPRLGFKDKID